MSVTKVTHRGIQWQRDSQDRIRWWNDDRQSWVRWRPGDDAPPRPPGWERRTQATAPPPLTRPAWRSPYRVIPLILVTLVIVVGVVQVVRSNGSSGSSAKETSESEAYAGRCLPKVGTSPSAGYSSTPVSCSAPNAAGKVVAVVTWEAGAKSCPAATTPAILSDQGVSRPHFECIAPLPGR